MTDFEPRLPASSKYVRLSETNMNKEHGVIYDESWKRTIEEIEDEHIEEEIDEIERLKAIEKAQRSLGLKLIREQLKEITKEKKNPSD